MRTLRFTWQRRPPPGIQYSSKWSTAAACSSEPVEHVVERLDRLAGVEVERRHALQRHLGDDAERAEADPGDAQQVVVEAHARRRDR